MNEFKLTEEQKRRIERNRLEALEKLRNRQERLARESAAIVSKNASPQESLRVNLQLSTNAPQAAAGGDSHPTKWWKPDTGPAPPKRPAAAAPSQSSTIPQKAKVKIVFQLDSPKTFSATASPALNSIYRAVPGSSYAAGEQLWKFPLSQYDQLCKFVLHFGSDALTLV